MEPDQACFLPPITENRAWEDGGCGGRHSGGSDGIGFMVLGSDVTLTSHGVKWGSLNDDLTNFNFSTNYQETEYHG